MKEKIKIILIIGIIMIVAVIGIWQYQHQDNRNYCKKECKHMTYQWGTWDGSSWQYFSDREQCIDYCLELKLYVK